MFLVYRYEYKAVEHKHLASPAVATASDSQGRRPVGQAVPSARYQSHGTAALDIPGMPRPMIQSEIEDQTSLEVYARSLVYQPDTPVLPAPFR